MYQRYPRILSLVAIRPMHSDSRLIDNEMLSYDKSLCTCRFHAGFLDRKPMTTC